MKHEIWVTYIKDGETAKEAFDLARSLRRVFTNRKIFVLVSKELDDEGDEQHLVNTLFDGSITLPMGVFDEKNVADFELFAKAYCWSLNFFGKIFFLQPNCLILRNCDDLFDLDTTNSIYFSSTCCSMDSPCFLVEPSPQVYLKLWEFLKPDAPVKKVNGDNPLMKMINKLYSVQTFSEELFLDFNFVQGDSVFCTPGIVHMGKKGSGRLTPAQTMINNLVNKVKLDIQAPEVPLFCSGDEEPVAIIGMACRLPGANNANEFWSLLINKENAIGPIGKDRWTADQSCVLDSDSAAREVGFLKCPIDHFDSQFFGMSPMELTYTDPQQRLLLEVAWEALEDAVIDPLSVYGRNVGVFTGAWTNDYRDLLIESGFKGTEFFRTFMGNSFGASSARISYFLGTTGPNIAVESGCSGSFISINSACDSLRKGETELALCCGVNLLLHPFRYDDMKAVISADSRCKAFDEKANGFVRSEGVAALVLKKLSDAIRDEDKILAVVRGSGVAQEGLSKSMGTPTVHCESLAMELALKNAKISPNEVSYLEAHGTGTAVGDPMEIKAIEKAYSSSQLRETPLLISSVKTNIGHAEACSGMASIIKIIKAFEHEVIPPHQSLGKLNPAINLDNIPAQIPVNPVPWKKYPNGKPRLAGVSNFGISGTDCHLILQEAPLKSNAIASTTTDLLVNVITLSAKTRPAFVELIENQKKYIGSHGNLNLNDVAGTLNQGRGHFPFRISIIAKDVKDLVQQMDKFPAQDLNACKEMPKICFMFTGQGSQYYKMCYDLYVKFPKFRQVFDKCEAFLVQRYKVRLADAIWGESKEKLNLAIYCQTAIFVLEVCLTKLLESWGIKPDVVVGHSLGEFAAAVASGLLELEEALVIVVTRSQLTDKLPPGRMMAVQASYTDILALKDEFEQDSGHWLDVAGINSKSQTVVSGSPEAISGFEATCRNRSYITFVLDSNYAYHSRHTENYLKEFRKVLEETLQNKKASKRNVTFISGCLGTNSTELGPDYWCNQARDSVCFANACTNIKKLGVRLCLEVGPTPVLVNIFRANFDHKDVAGEFKLLSSQKRGADQVTTLLQAVSELYNVGCDIDWREFHKSHIWKKINLPFYPFQRKAYWFPKPNKKMLTRPSNTTWVEGGHPLIGKCIECPEKLNIYQQFLQLEQISWVKDHALGNIVVFPGAGYVEMGLAVAKNLGKFPVLEKIKITSAWCLEDQQTFELQAIHAPDSGSVSIYTREISQGKGKWVNNAAAVVGDWKSVEELLKKTPKMRDVQNHKRSNMFPDIYAFLKTLGYNFGMLIQTVAKLSKGQDDFWAELEIAQEIAESEDEYVIHPIIIDAVMQAFVIATTASFKELRVPVYIHKFAQITNRKVAKGYLQIYGERLSNCTFYAEDGEVLALLVGLETTPTTFDALKKALSSSGEIKPPPIFKEEWLPVGGLPFNFTGPFLNSTISNELTKLLTKESRADPVYFAKLEESICIGILRSFVELGFKKFENDVKFTASDAILTFKIREEPHSQLLLRRLFEVLVEDGWLQFESKEKDVFKVKKAIPSLQELTAMIYKNVEFCGPHLATEWEFSLKFLNEMTNIFLGKTSALKLLFPDQDKTFSAERFYEEADFSNEGNAMLGSLFEKVLLDRYAATGRELRLVEIGAGTGSATKKILPILKKLGIPFEYMFTDISSAFFIKAEKTFKEYLPNMRFRALNVEQDPIAQGFAPFYYDICIASNVLHATKDLGEAVCHARQLLKSFGHIFLFETYIPQRHFDITVGHLGGYWLYEDFQLRKYHCVINRQEWEDLLRKSGFDAAFSIPVFYGGLGVTVGEAGAALPIVSKPAKKLWLLLTENGNEVAECVQERLKSVGKLSKTIYYGKNMTNLTAEFQAASKSFTVEGVIYLRDFKTAQVSEQISLGYLNFLKSFLACKPFQNTRLVLVTEGINHLGDQRPNETPSGGELLGMTKVFQTENPSIPVKIVDVEGPLGEKTLLLMQELFTSYTDLTIAYRNQQRFLLKLASSEFNSGFAPLHIPDMESFCLVMPDSKTITDLKFKQLEREPPTGTLVEIKVAAVAINFRDIFLVFQTFDKRDVSLGSDISGVVVAVGPQCYKLKVGDPVLGGRMQQKPLPSYTLIDEEELILIPPTMTFEQAATFPVAFATAYYCLLTLGKLCKGETVLIHTASGGVGLCAVQIAKSIDAHIIATAGSNRKRAYLRSLGISAVYDSRSLLYSDQILEQTGGKGVELVLNSLTGVGYKEATLACLKKNGRFIEMSKINIWSSAEIQSLRKDVTYEAVDLSDHQVDRWRYLMGKLREYIWTKKIEALPYTRFDVCHIREALATQQRARQIGKVVCSFAEPGKEGLFNGRSTYLVTGGLKGVGLCVVEWMFARGGRHFALVGRSAPSNECLDTINKLREQGAYVKVFLADVGSMQEMKRVFVEIQGDLNLPPVGGIMHAAGCLSDASIPNQTKENFKKCLHPKINGSWNLHLLTRGVNLEHFVMFSSFASLIGPPGQSNHAAANAFMDQLASYRNSVGLHALSVNWGQWGETGIVAGLKIHAYTPFTNAEGLSALERLMRAHAVNAAVVDGDISTWKILFPWSTSYLSNIEAQRAVHKEDAQVDTSVMFWEKMDDLDTPEEQLDLIKKNVRAIVSVILQMQFDEGDEEEGDFRELHLDSLMVIELKNFVQSLLGDDLLIGVIDLTDCSTVELISKQVYNIVSSAKNPKAGGAMPHLRELIKADSILWKDTILSPGNKRLTPVSKIQTILFTGATGNLGPYMLQILSNRAHIKKIICLVRPRKNIAADARLTTHLKQLNIISKINMDKITVISGDVTEPFMGIGETQYYALCQQVDAVFHCAVHSNHLDFYQSPTSPEMSKCRQVNVFGMQRVLKFASEEKTKWVYYAASIISLFKANEDSTGLPEGWPGDDEMDNAPDFGYAISKFVADKLCEEAVVKRNMPVKVFRLPLLGGDSNKGLQKVLNNHFLIKFIYYLKCGLMPDDDVPIFCLPVDTGAKLSCDLFFNEEVKPDVYNVLNPRSMSEQEIPGMAKQLGFTVKVVSFQQFVDHLKKDDEKSLIRSVKDFYTDKNKYMKLTKSLKYIPAWRSHPHNFFKSDKVAKYLGNYEDVVDSAFEVLKRDLKYALENTSIFKYGDN